MATKYCPACGEDYFENCTNLACPLGLEYIRTNFTGEYDALRSEFNDESWQAYLVELNEKLPRPSTSVPPTPETPAQLTILDSAALDYIISGLAEGEAWKRINNADTPVFQALLEFRDALLARTPVVIK